MKLRALAVFAIATLLPSLATAQQSTVCFKVRSSYVGSPRDTEIISESIAAILVENLPEAWSCENNPDAYYWLVYGVTVGFVDDSDGRRRHFDAYLSSHFWWGSLTEPRAPVVSLTLRNYTSVREAAEEFELRIRRDHRDLAETDSDAEAWVEELNR